jgi:hypothetical protein
VQLRKLYDPQQFPGAGVLPIFDRMFGSKRTGVCAMGVEANPHHTQYLSTLNTYFKQRGYQAMILTEVAASTHSGTASFFLDAGSPVEWGASLTQGQWQHNPEDSTGKNEVRVQLLDLKAFVTGIVRPILQQELVATGNRAARACIQHFCDSAAHAAPLLAVQLLMTLCNCSAAHSWFSLALHKLFAQRCKAHWRCRIATVARAHSRAAVDSTHGMR